ncbi:Dolichyl-diphosphooligosaccharide--protein glycosyltransferase 48 kDa subunit [Dirofilaria immitis]|nr:Dolichyl-diphosphooligosaccharide--protein glycosyltransferase 48 kDa subunit [Dirofilaria immitis]
MRSIFMLANSVTLEDGEIQDDDNSLTDTRRITSTEMISENMTHISSSLDEEREREVDRIIREVQEAAHRSEFMNFTSAKHSVENVNSDDEDALRLAVLNTSKDRRFVPPSISQEAEEGEIIDASYVVRKGQQINMHSSSRQTWVELKGRQNIKSQMYSDMQNRIKSRKFHEAATPLKVAVRNDNANSYCWILSKQQKAVAASNSVEMMETAVKQFSNPFEEQLHRLRLRVEASKFSKKVENLSDNYEQVGMDIVDSDRDSRSRSSPTSPLVDAMAICPYEIQSRKGVAFDGVDNEEDVDQLRAELLEQIMQRKNEKKLTSLKSSLEEGELSSANSEDQSARGSNEGPSSSYGAKPEIYNRSEGLLRSRKDDSLSSGSDDGPIQDYHIKLPRKRKESFREAIPKRLHWKPKDEFGDIAGIEARKIEDWERMINAEKKMLKEIERKLRHRDDQKSVMRRKRDNFLERANRCAHQLGVLEAEMEVLRCDQEKAEGRLSYLERQLDKAQCEEKYKNNVGHVYEPTQIVIKPVNDAEVPGMIKASALKPSELLNNTIAMDYSDGRDDISRPTTSSNGSQSSPIDILRDSDIIELSDSNDSMNGLITAMRELEQEELRANFTAEAATTISSNVYRESPQRARRINRNVTLSEKDVNELKNNPLIMFNGYRISPTFPFHLIAHRALSNKLDPLKPLCYYELLGRCADPTCSMQHEEDYLLSDEELICTILAYCPNLCPPKRCFVTEYACEILKQHEAKPVGEIIEDMLKSLPDTERRIRICEMGIKCRPPPKLSKERGHQLTIKAADDQTLTLTKFGEHLYDHLIIFAPGCVSDSGARVGDALHDLAAENGFEFDENRTAVIDHLNYDIVLDEGDHTTIVADPSNLLSAPMIVGKTIQNNPILFRGVALIADKTNQLRLEILSASTTAYSFNPHDKVEEYPGAVGRSTLLIGAIQARNNARVVLTGSIAMFSDAFIDATVNKYSSTTKPQKSGNFELVTELSKWVFMEKGVLKVKSVSHHKIGEKSPPREYTILDSVEYTIEIEELTDGTWEPFRGTMFN